MISQRLVSVSCQVRLVLAVQVPRVPLPLVPMILQATVHIVNQAMAHIVNQATEAVLLVTEAVLRAIIALPATPAATVHLAMMPLLVMAEALLVTKVTTTVATSNPAVLLATNSQVALLATVPLVTADIKIASHLLQATDNHLRVKGMGVTKEDPHHKAGTDNNLLLPRAATDSNLLQHRAATDKEVTELLLRANKEDTVSHLRPKVATDKEVTGRLLKVITLSKVCVIYCIFTR